MLKGVGHSNIWPRRPIMLICSIHCLLFSTEVSPLAFKLRERIISYEHFHLRRYVLGSLWSYHCYPLSQGIYDITMYSIARVIFRTCPVWWMMSEYVWVVYPVHNDRLDLPIELEEHFIFSIASDQCDPFTYILQGWFTVHKSQVMCDYLTGTGAIIWLPQCQCNECTSAKEVILMNMGKINRCQTTIQISW